MKKQVVLALLIICFCAPAFAQLGFQVGWNTTSYRLVRNGTHESRGLKMGVNAGLMYRIGGKHLCIQPTVLYSQKGAINNNIGTPYVAGVDRYRNKMNYVEFSMPVILKMNFAHKCSFDIGAGPYFGSLVSAVSNIKYLDGSSKDAKFNIGSDSTDDFKRNDIGMVIYMGAKFSHFNMSMSYTKGFMDINPGKNETTKTGCFSFNFGIFIK